MKIFKLNSFADERGHLFELFRLTENPEIKMSYVIVTNPGFGRDKENWHIHYFKTEMFVGLSGCASIAVKTDNGVIVQSLYNSSTGPLMITVEPGEGHSVMNFTSEPATVIALCDTYYDTEDEHRFPMEDWSWEKWKDLQKNPY